MKKSFPLILKDEETGDRVVLTENGKKRVSEEEDDGMHHDPEFDLPQDVDEPEDEMHDSEDSEINEPQDIDYAESVDEVMEELFADDVASEDEVQNTVKEETIDPMEHWIAPTIEEETTSETTDTKDSDTIQLPESAVRKVIQQEIQNLLG